MYTFSHLITYLFCRFLEQKLTYCIKYFLYLFISNRVRVAFCLSIGEPMQTVKFRSTRNPQIISPHLLIVLIRCRCRVNKTSGTANRVRRRWKAWQKSRTAEECICMHLGAGTGALSGGRLVPTKGNHHCNRRPVTTSCNNQTTSDLFHSRTPLTPSLRLLCYLSISEKRSLPDDGKSEGQP